MEKYVDIELEVIRFDSEDVIVTSTDSSSNMEEGGEF